MDMKENIVATFSIVAYDPQTKEWGIAVQSKFLAVGSLVPWAKADVGAIATQSYANTAFGPEGLRLLEQGKSAQEVLDTLLKDDDEKDFRQVGIVDSKGRAATFTGKKCHSWAGGVVGENYAAQGNILVSEETITKMVEVFEGTSGELARRLLKALEAGQSAGGDARGQQSAALLIVQEKAGYRGYNDVKVDLRVDEHSQPITELKRIYAVHQNIYGKRS